MQPTAPGSALSLDSFALAGSAAPSAGAAETFLPHDRIPHDALVRTGLEILVTANTP